MSPEQDGILIDGEIARLKVILKGIGINRARGYTDTPTFQGQVAEELKYSGIRMIALAAGDYRKAKQPQYVAVVEQLRRQSEYLAKFGQDIEAGISEAMLLWRVQSYSRFTALAYSAAVHAGRKLEGYTEGKRRVDWRSITCWSCDLYHTNGKWVPIADLVPPGVNCECGGRCRCYVQYRKGNFLSDEFQIPYGGEEGGEIPVI